MFIRYRYIAWKSLNSTKGDEVITVSNTAIPTVAAIVNCGATVKFADIGNDYLMDVNKLERLLHNKTQVIIPVHLYGQTCNMDKILLIAKNYKLKIIEDCAQSTGALYKHKKAGILGDIGSGKSFVSKQFKYPVFNADNEVNNIYKKNKDCFRKLKKK